MIHVKILTPTGLYLDDSVDYIEVRAPHSVLGILPGHAPLVSTLEIGPLIIKKGYKKFYYAASGGVINVKKHETVILLNSVERSDEIDYQRALDAKERAMKRIEESKLNKASEIDIARAETSLSRALNRIDVYSKYK